MPTDEMRRSNIVITSEAGLRAWMAGRFSIETARREELFMFAAPAHSMLTVTQMLAVSNPAVVSS
ncbi:hypothetical protein [Paraburkholderia fungorum]|uniref:hypothetical protein n=1 Tax=Paraburkholderia fungorum TaxID=134537 RepID=UPI001160058F|nr:hypothetical protein [Paraburkholderia fungorum]